MGRRPGQVCDGAVRGFQPAQIPDKEQAMAEDQGFDLLERHLPDGISWRGDGWRGSRLQRLYRGAGPVGMAAAAISTIARRSCGDGG